MLTINATRVKPTFFAKDFTSNSFLHKTKNNRDKMAPLDPYITIAIVSYKERTNNHFFLS